MAKRKGNPDIKNHGFKKGDPRINRKGRPKVLPLQKALMIAMFGVENEEDLSKSQIGQVVQAMIDETKNKKLGAQRMKAAELIMERVFGKVKAAEAMSAPEPIVWNEVKTYAKDNPKGKK